MSILDNLLGKAKEASILDNKGERDVRGKIPRSKKTPPIPLIARSPRYLLAEKHRYRLFKELKFPKSPAVLRDITGFKEKATYKHLAILGKAGLIYKEQGDEDAYSLYYWTDRGKLLAQEFGL